MRVVVVAMNCRVLTAVLITMSLFHDEIFMVLGVGDKQMERLVELLKSHGGTVVCGGQYDVKDRYIQPTVIQVTPVLQGILHPFLACLYCGHCFLLFLV